MEKLWKVSADFAAQTLMVSYADGKSESLPLYSLDAFRVISRAWLKTGWACKFSYNFAWMGRPIIQLPEDLMAIQDVIYRVRPDVIVETGVAHGGSSVFYASLFETLSHGRVISIDVEIRPHNRKALEQHPLKKRITLVEGSSIAPETVEQVRTLIKPDERVMVVLDSNHTKKHVLSEMELYQSLVNSGSYIVVADGNMDELDDVPGGKPDWARDNPKAAIHEFLASHSDFKIDQQTSSLGVTYWPDGYLVRE